MTEDTVPLLRDLLLYIVPIVLLCIAAVSGLVVAKFSFVRLRSEHIEEMEGLSDDARRFLTGLYEKPERFINTAQFLILFCITVLAVSIGEGMETLARLLRMQGGKYAEMAGIIDFRFFEFVVLLFVSAAVLLFGEIIPKGMGLSFPERYVRRAAQVVVFVGKIVSPIVAATEAIGNLILKFREAPYRTEIDLVHTEEELRLLVSRSHQEGAIDRIESELIDNVFDFVDRMAKEVMIPRQEVDCLYVEDSFEDTMHTIATTSHTRYPLCEEDKDHIIGLVHIKDLMDKSDAAAADLRNIRRDILVIPEVMKLSTLLQYMRMRRIYQAVVMDEYGGMVGLVGLEDIIEELVGDIQDEHETKAASVVANRDGSFEFDGTVLVDDVEDSLDAELSDADEDTVGGFVFGLLERTPSVGDSVTEGGFVFTVTAMQGYRIARVHVRPLRADEVEPSEGGTDV